MILIHPGRWYVKDPPLPSSSPMSEVQTGEEANVAMSTFKPSDKYDANGDSDDNETIVYLLPFTRSRGGGGKEG